MKTNIQLLIALTLTMMAVGCGKKDPQEIHLDLPGDTTSNQTVGTPQDSSYENSYNLLDGNTVSTQDECKSMLGDGLDVSGATAYAVSQQTQKIKEICGKSPAFQGQTKVEFVCRVIDSASVAPEAKATTPYRCN